MRVQITRHKIIRVAQNEHFDRFKARFKRYFSGRFLKENSHEISKLLVLFQKSPVRMTLTIKEKARKNSFF
jgi:hypothetical protein